MVLGRPKTFLYVTRVADLKKKILSEKKIFKNMILRNGTCSQAGHLVLQSTVECSSGKLENESLVLVCLLNINLHEFKINL